jgi:Leucine-rich repeat (LRR) protein
MNNIMKNLYLALVAFLFLAVAHAQIVNIPDGSFKSRLLQASSSNYFASTQTPDSNGNVTTYNAVDTNSDGEIQVSEASVIKYLVINGFPFPISSLEGITSFTNLEYLNCNGNQMLSSLNVSGLTNLRYLTCFNCSLSSLNVSGLTNLKYLNCLSNYLQSLNLNGLTNLQTLNCSVNGMPSLNLNGLTNLQTLNCSINGISTLNLSGLTNLTNLDCGGNLLTSLDVSSLHNLLILSYHNNQLPSVDFSGITNLQQLNCSSNQIASLDVSNLISLEQLNCSSNLLTSLDVSSMTSMQQLNCSNNQLPSLNVSTLSNLTNLYCSNNQLPSLSVIGLTNLNTLDFSNNQITSINFSGIVNLQYLYCSNNQLTSIDISGFFYFVWLECDNNQLTSLFIYNTGSSLFSLSFANNPNIVYICAGEYQVWDVQQKINYYGYTNCQVNNYCNFTPGGTFYTIQGNNKFDGNNNGCDASDSLYSNLKFAISSGNITGSFISNASGNYSIPVFPGTHNIMPQFENPTYFTASPTSATVTFPATTSPFIQNFCITPNGVHHDLEVIVIPVNVARPGFDAAYKIKYKNKGNQTENATLSFNYNDAILDYVSSSVSPATQGLGTLSWSIGTLTPFKTGEIIVTLNVNSPTETPPVNAGNLLSYTATVIGSTTDETPDDNSSALSQVVVNSFDPNDKTCLEGSVINPSMIGKYVHYKIRFENTGTFAAQNIVLKDMIDTTKFDVSTLQITDASHSCVTRITNPNKVEFIFENINLPFDDANNDGYVVFKIKTKPTLTVGSTISNSANIYFDYNFPIVTNTATSTFSVLQNDTFVFDNYFTIYPNPVAEILNLKTKQETQIYTVTIYNTTGQQVQTITNPSNAIDVASLKTGNYLVKVVTDKGISRSKFVKE